MKRIVVLTLAAAALAVPAAQAQAATPSPTVAQFKALQKQVKTLQAQVKALQKWVPTSCTTATCFNLRQVSNLTGFSFEYNICQAAAISDEFQATWNVIDQIGAAMPTPKTYFGPQTSITEPGACADLRITRPSGIPPTVAIFSSLVTLLTG